ncbi:MAG: septal ring lytic transglycosylase RlpA [Oceanospirillaceae bacterium]|nr:septal ring lytic transglycosylase RlpA [Oceanospirillaceae bacterium]|tara:strand:+ start:272 stop:1045 length:774 start_codon:yes stop_codon:yes gene_type:complete
MKKYATLAGVALLVTACSDRYQHDQDFKPPEPPQTVQAQQPTPRSEPLSVSGNDRTYRVRGETYWVQFNPELNQTEHGIASWYGMKFHGHATSSGEIYDVYQYTAAHKTLPLPSYVKVTRQDNGKSVVVKVNDRGPFHEGRIIDLSYQAAKHIGLDRDGTTDVTVTLLAAPMSYSERWIQISALSNPKAAREQQKQVQSLIDQARWPVQVHVRQQNGQQLHKVRIGPVPEGKELQKLLQTLDRNNFRNVAVLASHQL